MFHEPLTLEEAKKYRYNTWAGNSSGRAYVVGRCAAQVYRQWLSYQCSRKNGKGPNGLYCGIHVKQLKIAAQKKDAEVEA
jgi:hypothetical protein